MKTIRIVAAGVAVVAAAALAASLLRGGGGTTPSGAPGTSDLPKLPTIGFVVGSAADGRWGPEPCCGIIGGGLYSLPALRDQMKLGEDMRVRLPLTVSAFLGDVGPGPGDLGRLVAHFVWTEIVDDLDFQFAAPGPADLALGAEFVRTVLAPLRGCGVLCANATDAGGNPILPGWKRAEAEQDGRKSAILCVAVVAESLQGEVAATGSDVRLLPAAPAAAAAMREAEAAAARQERRIAHRILLVHGTVEETAAIVGAVPGLSFAVAARGGPLGDEVPRRVGDVPVYYPGRGLRFGHRLISVDGGPVAGALIRIGVELYAVGSPIAGPIGGIHDMTGVVGVREFVSPVDRRPVHPEGEYVGAAACAPCHAEQVSAHETSPHRRAGRRLESRLDRTNTQCLACHATAAFFRGGWRGPDDTSDLGGVSCETCHGPGARHAAEPKAGWGKVDLALCRSCHTPERSPEFDPKAVWDACGHGAR